MRRTRDPWVDSWVPVIPVKQEADNFVDGPLIASDVGILAGAGALLVLAAIAASAAPALSATRISPVFALRED